LAAHRDHSVCRHDVQHARGGGAIDDDTRKGTAGLVPSRYGENSTITIAQNVGYGSNHSFILHTNQDLLMFDNRGTVYSPLPKALSLQTVGAGASLNFLKPFTASVTLAVPVLHTTPGQRDVRMYARLVAHAF